MQKSEHNSWILHEDEDLLIVDKPAGLPVYPLSGKTGDTVCSQLLKTHPQLETIGPPGQLGILHRLDNDTSGILVATKNKKSYSLLKDLWNTKQITKEYHALVTGKIATALTLSDPIAHHPSRKNKMMVCETATTKVINKGRPAITEIKRTKMYSTGSGQIYSYVSARITTGVRHQIRVHLAAHGHPIVGDRLYQNWKKKRLDNLGLDRQFLHLYKIQIPHPKTGKIFKVICKLPRELNEILSRLK